MKNENWLQDLIRFSATTNIQAVNGEIPSMAKCTEVRLHNFPCFKFNISVAIDKFIPTLNIKFQFALQIYWKRWWEAKHEKKWKAASGNCFVSGNLTTGYAIPTFLNWMLREIKGVCPEPKYQIQTLKLKLVFSFHIHACLLLTECAVPEFAIPVSSYFFDS